MTPRAERPAVASDANDADQLCDEIEEFTEFKWGH